MCYCTCIIEHIRSNTKNRACDLVDQDKRDQCCKSTAGSFLCPGTTNSDSEQNMQVIDDRPSDVLHSTSNGKDQGNIRSCHLHQLTDTDHQSGCRHNSNNCHKNFTKFLQKIKVKIKLFLFFFLWFGSS